MIYSHELQTKYYNFNSSIITYTINTMNDKRQKKENVKIKLKELRQNLKKMHLEVTEELKLPQPDEVKTLMKKMDQLLKLIE